MGVITQLKGAEANYRAHKCTTPGSQPYVPPSQLSRPNLQLPCHLLCSVLREELHAHCGSREIIFSFLLAISPLSLLHSPAYPLSCSLKFPLVPSLPLIQLQNLPEQYEGRGKSATTLTPRLRRELDRRAGPRMKDATSGKQRETKRDRLRGKEGGTSEAGDVMRIEEC